MDGLIELSERISHQSSDIGYTDHHSLLTSNKKIHYQQLYNQDVQSLQKKLKVCSLNIKIKLVVTITHS